MLKTHNHNIHDTQYEQNHNLLYIAVNPTGKSGIRSKAEIDRSTISNMAIYDLATQETTYLFDKNDNKTIRQFIYESSHNEKERYIAFNTSHANTITNHDIAARPCADRLFIITEGKQKEEQEFWMSDKRGNNKTLVRVLDKHTQWKLDIKHQRVIFIQRLGGEVKVETVGY